MSLPQLYPILDAGTLATLCDPGELVDFLLQTATELFAAGCALMQLRAKQMTADEQLWLAQAVRQALPSATLILNDRADLAVAAGFDGVHVGQEDLSPEAARTLVGPGRIVGLSTHNAQQFAAALLEPVDYLALGPVFATVSKANADPVVGLEGVRAARRLLIESGKAVPLVAIGGINRENARAVLAAGADSVAVIGDLCRAPGDSARAFFRLML
ncbi:MAG: thiamine phosphate synthase [Acidobacteriota bacterium]|nr:thiamine phosphate synthase [Acidobacteriota bacterium]